MRDCESQWLSTTMKNSSCIYSAVAPRFASEWKIRILRQDCVLVGKTKRHHQNMHLMRFIASLAVSQFFFMYFSGIRSIELSTRKMMRSRTLTDMLLPMSMPNWLDNNTSWLIQLRFIPMRRSRSFMVCLSPRELTQCPRLLACVRQGLQSNFQFILEDSMSQTQSDLTGWTLAAIIAL